MLHTVDYPVLMMEFIVCCIVKRDSLSNDRGDSVLKERKKERSKLKLRYEARAMLHTIA
jgi:hypothetical protein